MVNTFLVGAFIATIAFTHTTSLRICHHNDFHARYAQVNKFNSPCSEEDSNLGQCFSSFTRLRTVFEQYKCDRRIHAGDFVQGSAYDSVFGVDIAIKVYEHLKYDILTFGNHEWNKGPNPVYQTISSAPNETRWLSSNTKLTNAPSNVTVHSRIEQDDICWISALTPVTKNISSPGPSVIITDPAIALNQEVQQCTSNTSVIAITHVGYQQDIELCKSVKSIDLVIGGHSHTNLVEGNYPTRVEREDGSVCWVVQARAFGLYVGVLDIAFNDDGVLEFQGVQYVPLDNRIERNIDAENLLRVYTQRLSQSINKVVGSVTKPVDGARDSCRAMECEMGNLVCDALLDYAGPQESATLCIQNGGGIRASFNEGPVTIEEILTVLPFSDVHAVLTVPGSTIMAGLENGLLAIGNDEINGRFPQVGGMNISVDFAAPPGSRLQKVVINGTDIEPAKQYRLVTSTFLANGGDGYVWTGATDINLSGRGLDTLLSEYLTENNPYTPTPTNVTKRIVGV